MHHHRMRNNHGHSEMWLPNPNENNYRDSNVSDDSLSNIYVDRDYQGNSDDYNHFHRYFNHH
jgi:hypothetical protein